MVTIVHLEVVFDTLILPFIYYEENSIASGEFEI